MRRPDAPLTLVTLAVALGLVGAVGLVACGGSDKPPLTPDTVEPPADEAGAPVAPVTAPPPRK